MKTEKTNTNGRIVPVLLGADLNAYSMALSFAAAAGVRSHVFARERLALTDTSSFVKLHTVKDLDDYNTAVPVLKEFAMRHKGDTLILVPCADWYTEMLEYARDALVGHFYFFIPEFEIWRTVSDKATLYAILDKWGIAHPRGAVFDRSLADLGRKCERLTPPFVIKASDSSEYFSHPFEKMKKVYFADSVSECRKIAEKIFASGYDGKLIVQEKIFDRVSGKDALSSVLTTFSDSQGRVIRAVLGDVLLEERGDTSRGNYSAIVTRPLDGISRQIIEMLEGIGYTGIANFDILRDGERSYCLELNPRQGRSFDYLRGTGTNIAELLIGEMRGERREPVLEYEDCYWRAVSRRTVMKNAEREELLERALILERAGRVFTPYDHTRDNAPWRRLYVLLHLLRCEGRFSRERRAPV